MVLSEEIAIIAKEQVIQNITPPIEAKVTKLYADGYVNVSFENGELFHVKTNGITKAGDEVIVIFIENDMNNPLCLVSGEGGGDLSNYVTKQLLNTILSSYATLNALDNYALSNHIHDNRYYTEYEVDTKLNNKQNKGDTITSIGLIPKAQNNLGAIRLYYGDEPL